MKINVIDKDKITQIKKSEENFKKKNQKSKTKVFEKSQKPAFTPHLYVFQRFIVIYAFV